LVIGNGAYTSAPPLRNPPNDARDIAATLKELAFDVTSGINVNQRDFKRLIREFGQKLKAGGSGLFYYAGHGVQSRGRNYLIPVDADIQSEAEVEDSGVDVGLVLNYMDDAQNGLNIVILDACRNNPFSRSFRSVGEGLAQVDAPTGTLIAYATAPGRVASDGAGQNGLYTSELLRHMRVPGLSATEMFMHVRAEVMRRTGNKQVPWEASSLVGAFYFSPSKSVAGAQAGAAAGEMINPAAFELSYWDSIKNSTDLKDFQSYIEKYPNGQFVTLAKNRISGLESSAKPVESERTSSETSSLPGNNSRLAVNSDTLKIDENGRTTLMLAAGKGRADLIPAIIAAGVDVNVGDNDGDAALYYAATNGKLEAMDALLKAGANINGTNKKGSTALIGSAAEGLVPVVRLLLARGARPDQGDVDGDNALILASALGKTDVMDELLSGRANIDAQNKNGVTPLMIASFQGHVAAVRLLISRRANVNVRAKSGVTALTMATTKNRTDVAEILRQAGARE
jgi:ankyrin repeat protein